MADPSFSKKILHDCSNAVSHRDKQGCNRFPADFYSLHEQRKAAKVGELINIVLDAIEEDNKAGLEGVFQVSRCRGRKAIPCFAILVL